MDNMTAKQKLFCDEYLIDLNATQAAIRAGYSEKYAHTNASKLLQNTTLKKYIDEHLSALESDKIADAKEVMEYLTSVLRGESQSEVVVIEGTGKGYSEARIIEKGPDEKDRLKAAELLGKRYGLHIDKEEHKARIEKMKAETARIKGEDLDEEAIDDGFLEALNGSAREDWSDEAED